MEHTFARWLQLAESRAASVTGLDLDSLGAEGVTPCLRDAYDGGESPSEHADHVIAESGFPTEPDTSTQPAYVPAERRASGVRSKDITTGETFNERLASGRQLHNRHIRLALDQRAALGQLPVLY